MVKIEQRRGVAKTTTTTLSLSDLKAALPSLKFALVGLLATALLHRTFGRSIVIERKIKVEIQMIPYRLPDSCPVERICLSSILESSLLSPSSSTPLLDRTRRSC
jgi:hypothetical protein